MSPLQRISYKLHIIFRNLPKQKQLKKTQSEKNRKENSPIRHTLHSIKFGTHYNILSRGSDLLM